MVYQIHLQANVGVTDDIGGNVYSMIVKDDIVLSDSSVNTAYRNFILNNKNADYVYTLKNNYNVLEITVDGANNLLINGNSFSDIYVTSNSKYVINNLSSNIISFDNGTVIKQILNY